MYVFRETLLYICTYRKETFFKNNHANTRLPQRKKKLHNSYSMYKCNIILLIIRKFLASKFFFLIKHGTLFHTKEFMHLEFSEIFKFEVGSTVFSAIWKRIYRLILRRLREYCRIFKGVNRITSENIVNKYTHKRTEWVPSNFKGLVKIDSLFSDIPSTSGMGEGAATPPPPTCTVMFYNVSSKKLSFVHLKDDLYFHAIFEQWEVGSRTPHFPSLNYSLLNVLGYSREWIGGLRWDVWRRKKTGVWKSLETIL
jgi:hypothetical protein